MTDLDQIRHTVALHPQTLDDCDVERYVSLFVEDARLSVPGGAEHVGHGAIRSFIEGYFASQPGRRTKHLFGNPRIELHGDHAESVSDVLVCSRTGDGPWTLATLTRHRDILVRRRDRWLFTFKQFARR